MSPCSPAYTYNFSSYGENTWLFLIGESVTQAVLANRGWGAALSGGCCVQASAIIWAANTIFRKINKKTIYVPLLKSRPFSFVQKGNIVSFYEQNKYFRSCLYKAQFNSKVCSNPMWRKSDYRIFLRQKWKPTEEAIIQLQNVWSLHTSLHRNGVYDGMPERDQKWPLRWCQIWWFLWNFSRHEMCLGKCLGEL